MKRVFIACLSLWATIAVYGQEDLLSQLDEETDVEPQPISATFKTTRILNMHSVETVGKGLLDMRINHRFGAINSGAYNFFGLDQASIRLGLEYGICDNLTFGIGRSSYNKTFDTYGKWKFLQQKTKGGTPISMVLLGGAAYESYRTSDTIIENNKLYKLHYFGSLLIARKFNERLSLELAPFYVHRNLVYDLDQKNDLYGLGLGGRYKFTKRSSINIDYQYVMPNLLGANYHNSLSLGIDIETGGHVFQLHMTNSQGMIESQYIGQTTGQWNKGDIYYGFNISRMFTIKKEKVEHLD